MLYAAPAITIYSCCIAALLGVPVIVWVIVKVGW